MSDIGPALPDDLGAMRRDYDRRLRNLERGEAGLSLPAPFTGLSTSADVTGASFGPVWESVVENLPGEVLVVETTLLVASATTVEVKLVEGLSGFESDVLSVSGLAFFSVFRWEWEHGVELGPDSRAVFQVEARRTAGSLITSYQPRMSIVRPKLEVPGAVPGGNPTAV